MNTTCRAPLYALLATSALLSGCIIISNGDDADDGAPSCDGPCDTGGTGPSTSSGGESSCDGEQVSCPCAEDGGCGASEACVSGACVPGCDFDHQCASGQRCAEGMCLPACDAEGGCAEGSSCLAGACLPEPGVACGESEPCASGVCVEGTCRENCASHAECAKGQLCNAATGARQPDLGPTPSCGPTRACAGTGQACVEGSCRYPCESLTDCKLVDARFEACDAGVCLTELEASPSCTLSIACPEGQLCVSNQCVQP
jgi:hypothetical protein